MTAPASDATVVCVLGMSRTGTSLTTRALSLAGVYLGPEEELLQKDLRQLSGEGEDVLARARETNPEGFWEHYRMMRLNERILRALGGSWREPPELRPGWEESEELDAERAEARSLIEQSFGGHRLWAWKDPRNSLTLPFWQRLLPSMRYVVCLRNPVDVAASLERRDGMPFAEAIDLWLSYVAAALVNTTGRPRLLVPYESYFEHPRASLARLAEFAGIDEAVAGTEAERLLVAAVEERLWRNRTTLSDVARDPRLRPEAVSLHLCTQLLATAAPSGSGDAPNRLAGMATAVDLYAKGLLGRLSAKRSGRPED